MKSLLFKLIIGIYICAPLTGLTKNKASESLQLVVDSSERSEKVNPMLLNQLTEQYRVNRNYKASLLMARQSGKIALEKKDYIGAAKAYTLLANIKANTKQFSALKQLSDSALLFGQLAHNSVAMAYGYYAQVLLYNSLEDTEKVVKYCQLGLKQLEKQTDFYLAAKIYYQLYSVHSDWNNETKVNAYAREATENALKAKDYNLLSNCYTALSMAHEYNYNTTKKKTELDSVLFYLSKSEVLYQQYPGQVAHYTYAIACINIANCYLKYFPETDHEAKMKGIRYARTARMLLKNVVNSQEVIASSLGLLSEYAKRDYNYESEERYLLEAYDVIKTEQPPYYYTLVNVVNALSDLYKRKGDYKKALAFQEEATRYSNKNFSQKQALSVQKLEVQYETENKKNEVQMLKEREKSRKLENYLYTGITFASILGLLFMFRAYHFRLRYSLQREKQLQLEKQDSELQIKLQKEEQARLRVEQQLMESQQQQLQKEVMANVLHLEHKNRMLLDIKDKLSEGDAVNMHKILREEMFIDNDFEDAKLQIQQVHPDFFNLINEKSHKKLTMLDLKLCAYLYIKMDTRQIAQLMHIEAKSVRMSRYRIKQKLGLEREEDLNAFLQGLG